MRFLIKLPTQSRANTEFRLGCLWVHAGRSCKPPRREIPQWHSLVPLLNYALSNFFSFYLNIINSVNSLPFSLSLLLCISVKSFVLSFFMISIVLADCYHFFPKTSFLHCNDLSSLSLPHRTCASVTLDSHWNHMSTHTLHQQLPVRDQTMLLSVGCSPQPKCKHFLFPTFQNCVTPK